MKRGSKDVGEPARQGSKAAKQQAELDQLRNKLLCELPLPAAGARHPPPVPAACCRCPLPLPAAETVPLPI
eukprot:5188465-Alexandrium_andersonii.AAC.1